MVKRSWIVVDGEESFFLTVVISYRAGRGTLAWALALALALAALLLT